MKNSYFLMRHGRSLSNDLKIAVSSPEKSINAYGLTPVGVGQAKRVAEKFVRRLASKPKPLIYSSDFLRAYETAEILAKQCGVGVTKDARLRERDFGELDGTSLENYHRVWNYDGDPDSTAFGSESLRHMVDRVRQLIDEIENGFEGETVVLVGHGDPLVAINSYTIFGDYRSPDHTKYYMENAEIRRLDELAAFVLP